MERRKFIQSTAALSTVFVLPSFNINKLKERPTDEKIIGHNGYRYKVRPEWGDLNPTKTPVRNCHEMVMDSKGRLVMITDEVKNNIIVYDKSGKLIKSFGHEFKGGHGLTLADENGEDFLIVCDTNYEHDKEKKKWTGRVVKYSMDGKIMMQLKNPYELGIYNEDQKFVPTETAVAPNGDIYVIDGYGSDFIIQYNHKGEYIRHFGGRNNENEYYNLFNAHGICVDLRKKNDPQLIASSRNRNCLKTFTMDGIYKGTINLSGAYPCRAVVHNENIYVGICWSKINGRTAKDTGYVTILDHKNRVVSNPGGTVPTYDDYGNLMPQRQALPIFKHCHDVCVDEDENLYICQWNANRTYPIKLERV